MLHSSLENNGVAGYLRVAYSILWLFGSYAVDVEDPYVLDGLKS